MLGLILGGVAFPLSAIFLVAFCYISQDSNQPWIKYLNTFFLEKPQRKWIQLLTIIGGPHLAGKWQTCTAYYFGGNTPLVQGFYLLLMTAGYICFIIVGERPKKHDPFCFYSVKIGFEPLVGNPRVPSWHRWVSFLMTISCLLFYSRLCTSDPGYIIQGENDVKALEMFPPDDIYFLKGRVCETCDFEKPGRSKHCRFCGSCIMKYDHHCIWFRNCIGLLNWGEFILFCLIHVLYCIYGSVLIPYMLLGEADRQRLWSATFWDGTKQLKTTNFVIAQYLLTQHTLLVGLCLLCFCMGIALTMFLGVHLWLHLIKKSTTNEILRPPQNTKKVKKQTESVALPKMSLREVLLQDFIPRMWLVKLEIHKSMNTEPEPLRKELKRRQGLRPRKTVEKEKHNGVV